MRSGLIGHKVGMTRVFDESGKHIPVTVVSVKGCKVLDVKNNERDGYVALQIGKVGGKEKNASKALKGHLSKSGVKSCSHIAEFRVSDECVGEIGAEILADHFIKGQKVDVVGTTIGKGFAGPMKRHNFGGMRASHGVSVSHRAHGSTGNCQDPGKVFKNKKMAGHMGNAACTVQNLTIVDIDTEDGILLIKGAVPGAKGSVVYIKDAVKVELPNDLPMPGSFEGGKDASSQQKANEAVDKSQAVEKEANKEKVKAEAEKQEADKKAEESQKTENKEEVKE